MFILAILLAKMAAGEGSDQNNKLAESIQTAVSGALSSVLTPVLQSLQSKGKHVHRDVVDANSSDDDFISPTVKKR